MSFAEGSPEGYTGVYDGAAHDALTALTVNGIEGETFVYGRDEMKVEYKVGDDWTEEMPQVTNVSDSKDIEIRVTVENYEPIEGSINATVTKKDVKLTSATDSKKYDGNPLTAESVTAEGFVEGEGATYSNFASITNVGSKNNTFEYTMNEGTLEGNYNIQVVNGKLTINAKEVFIIVSDAQKVFGTADPQLEVINIEGLINDSDLGSIIAIRTNKDEAVGVYNDVLDVSYTENSNYLVTVDKGDFTITQQSIDPGEDPDNPNPSYNGVTVNTPSNAEYDGAAHQWLPTVTAEDGTVLVLGTDYNVTYSTTDFTNVTGEIVVTITGAGNYAGEITRTYQITPRPVTLTSGSASKNYDGTALTNSEVSITSGSLVNASDVTYAAVGSITNVGSSLNRISVSYVSEQMARNYVVTLVEGTLTVNTAPTTPPTTPTTPPTTPGTPGTTTDDGDTTDEPEVEEVEDEETPLSDGDVEDVEDNATPKGNNGIWALINLIAAIVTVILGLILLLSKRHRNDEEEDEEERQARIERGEEKEQEQKRGWICKVLGVIVAIASVVFFILTEDMSLPMALTDKWTIWMIVIAIVELVLVLVGRHWKDVDDEDQEQQA